MLVGFYSFKKERNSTKIPDTADFVLDCILKEPFTLENLTLILKTQFPLNSVNYCYIDKFKSYYFITGWAFDSGRWFATCSIDALASFRADILATTQYVTRSSTEFDPYLPDASYPTSTIHTEDHVLQNTWDFEEGGTFIIGVVSGKRGTTNDAMGVALYAFDRQQFSAFKNALLGSISWLNTTTDEVSDNLAKMLVNPVEYITFCKWFPFDKKYIQLRTAVTKMPFGWWELNVECDNVQSQGLTFIKTMPYEDHPQALDRGIFLRQSPYTTITLAYPPFGRFVLPPEKFLLGDKKIHIKIIIDYTTGTGTMYVDKNSDFQANIIVVNCQIGVDIALAQIMFNRNASMEDVLFSTSVYVASDVLKNASAGADFSTIIASAGNGILSSISGAMSQMQVKGTQGSATEYHEKASVTYLFALLVQEDRERIGRPCCKKLPLQTLRGFVMCKNAHCPINGPIGLQEEVENYLNNGVYIE